MQAMNDGVTHVSVGANQWGKLFANDHAPKTPFLISELFERMDIPAKPEASASAEVPPAEPVRVEEGGDVRLASFVHSTPGRWLEDNPSQPEAPPREEAEAALGTKSTPAADESDVALEAGKSKEPVLPPSDEKVEGDTDEVASVPGKKRSRLTEIKKIPEEKLEKIFAKQDSSLVERLRDLCAAKGINPSMLGQRAAGLAEVSKGYFSMFISSGGKFRPSDEKLTAAALVLDLPDRWTERLLEISEKPVASQTGKKPGRGKGKKADDHHEDQKTSDDPPPKPPESDPLNNSQAASAGTVKAIVDQQVNPKTDSVEAVQAGSDAKGEEIRPAEEPQSGPSTERAGVRLEEPAALYTRPAELKPATETVYREKQEMAFGFALLYSGLRRLCEKHKGDFKKIVGEPIVGSADWALNACIRVAKALMSEESALEEGEREYLIEILALACPGKVFAAISGDSGDVLRVLLACLGKSPVKVKVITGHSD